MEKGKVGVMELDNRNGHSQTPGVLLTHRAQGHTQRNSLPCWLCFQEHGTDRPSTLIFTHQDLNSRRVQPCILEHHHHSSFW